MQSTASIHRHGLLDSLWSSSDRSACASIPSPAGARIALTQILRRSIDARATKREGCDEALNHAEAAGPFAADGKNTGSRRGPTANGRSRSPLAGWKFLFVVRLS